MENVFEYEQLKKDFEQADMIFIGIGEEFQVKLCELEKHQSFVDKRNELISFAEGEWYYPFLIKYYLQPKFHEKIVKTYRNIIKLAEKKDSFIVSVVSDDLLQKDIKYSEIKDKAVFPCGGYLQLQCEDDCLKKVYDLPEEMWQNFCRWVENRASLEEAKKLLCPDCGKDIVFNQYNQKNYNEKSYLNQWNTYKKWLEKTVNKRLLILELGVGMSFPSVIRWPMEKVCLYNKKSVFYRINSNLYQLPENMEDRAISVKMDAVDFVNEYLFDIP